MSNQEMKSPRLTQRAIRDLPELPEGREYLVMVPYGWAREPLAATALFNAKRNGVSRGKDLLAVVFDVPEDAWVDGIGTIRWTVPEGTEVTITEVAHTHYTRR